jgi:hypothetical protein
MAESTRSGTTNPFLPGFSNDIFLSYAHVDNRPERPDLDDQRGWVDRFVARLENVVSQRLGESVKIWRDDSDLKKADQISPTIQSAIEQSALFLVLLSNRYLKSESCANEVRWIEQQSRGREGRSIQGERVFPILLYRIPEAERPAICRDQVGFEFFDAKERSGSGRPLDPELSIERFTDQLDRLVNELVDRLRAVRKVLPSRPRSPKSDAYRVLITGTPGVRRRQRERLQQALTKDVQSTEAPRLPTIDVVNALVPPPYGIKAHGEDFGRLLEGVDLCVHLVDEEPGPVVEGAPDLCFPEEQCRLAHTRDVQQIVILPEFVDLEAQDVPSHRQFIEDLTRGVWPAEDKRGKLTVAKLATEDAILDLIRQERQNAARALAEAPLAGGSVFVELNTIDLRGVAPLFEFLAGLRLEPITIPSTDTSPSECRTQFVDSVTKSKALIIVYGEATLDWVKSRTLNAIRLIIERELPLKPIVAALPPAKQLDALAFLQCPIVDCTGGFNGKALSALIAGGRP